MLDLAAPCAEPQERTQYENPWDLPAVPADYRARRRWPPIQRPKLSLRQVNALLNLSLGCSVVFLCLVFPLLLYQSLNGTHALAGWRFVVVTGDSMEPAIRTGALVLAKESAFDRLEEGDVIVYRMPDGRLNTHRIVALEAGVVITKGDNALLPDAAPVTRDMYVCEVRKVFNGMAGITRALVE